MTETVFVPDRWLFLSQSALQSIRQTWAANAAEGTLLKLRMDDPWIVRATTPEALEREIRTLVEEGVETIHLVVDRLTIELAERLEGLPENVSVCEWRQSPHDVIGALSAPEGVLLDRHLGGGARTGPRGMAKRMPARFDRAWLTRYRTGMETWERRARDEYGEDFEEAYGPSIAWDKLIPTPSLVEQEQAGLLRSVLGVIQSMMMMGVPAHASMTSKGPGSRYSCRLTVEGHVLEMQFDLSAKEGEPVQVTVFGAAGGVEPAALALYFDGEISEMALEDARWDDDLFTPGVRSAVWSIADTKEGRWAKAIAACKGVPRGCDVYMR